MLLIEPVWNRNSFRLQPPARCRLAFNRTSMESKHLLKIVILLSPFFLTFNRTSMESKPPKAQRRYGIC